MSACATSAPPVAPAPTRPRFDIAMGTDLASGDLTAIVARGFAPGSEVEVVAERPMRAGPLPARVIYRAHARYRVAASGALDLATAPVSGTYEGADLRGLFWSMTPSETAAPDRWPDDEVHLVASQPGHTADATVVLRRSNPDVEVTVVGAELPGAVLARLPGSAPRPAIIVLGGSEGDDLTARDVSPRLASLGYAVLGLPYYAPGFGPPRAELAGLPTAFVDIPVERLEHARDWLRRAPGVDGDHIAVWGVSKGAELALLASTRFAWIDAIVAIVPTDVVWEGWGLPDQRPATRSSFAWRGEPLPFVPYQDVQAEFAKQRAGAMRRAHALGRAAHPDAATRARIPVERYRGAVLVAGAEDDQAWPSGAMAGNVARSRAAAGLATTALIYRDAGHALDGDGWTPTTPNPKAYEFGGTPVGNARAQAAVWRETRAFLARTLPPVPGRSK